MSVRVPVQANTSADVAMTSPMHPVFAMVMVSGCVEGETHKCVMTILSSVPRNMTVARAIGCVVPQTFPLSSVMWSVQKRVRRPSVPVLTVNV